MLIGNSNSKPNITVVRRIKRALHEVLELPEEAIITVVQLACLEDDCAPLETVVGLLRKGEAQLQYKVHKPTNALGAGELAQVCQAWGFDVQRIRFEPFFKEN